MKILLWLKPAMHFALSGVLKRGRGVEIDLIGGRGDLLDSPLISSMLRLRESMRFVFRTAEVPESI
jgi:hypothetical protein